MKKRGEHQRRLMETKKQLEQARCQAQQAHLAYEQEAFLQKKLAEDHHIDDSRAEIDLAAQHGRMAEMADAGDYEEYDRRGRRLMEDQEHAAREHYRREEEREVQDFKAYEAKLEAEAAERLVQELEEIIEAAHTAGMPQQPEWEIIKRQLDEFGIPYTEVTEEELTKQPITEALLHKWKRRTHRRQARRLRAERGQAAEETGTLQSDSEDGQLPPIPSKSAQDLANVEESTSQTAEGREVLGAQHSPPLIDLRESPPTAGEHLPHDKTPLPDQQETTGHEAPLPTPITPTAPFVPVPLHDLEYSGLGEHHGDNDDHAQPTEGGAHTTPASQHHDPHDAALAALVPIFDDPAEEAQLTPDERGGEGGPPERADNAEHYYIGDETSAGPPSPARQTKLVTSTSPDTKRLAQTPEGGDTDRPLPVPSTSSLERKANMAENPPPLRDQEHEATAAATAAEQGN